MTEKKVTSPIGIVLFILVGHFCVDFMIGIWPVFKTMEQLNLATAGLIASICALCSEGLQSLFGVMIDRGHQKRLLLFGISIATLSAFFCLVQEPYAFLFLLMGTFIGSAAFHPTASSLLGSLETRYKSSIMGWFTAAGMCGLGISQLLFVKTYETFEGGTWLLALPPVCLALVGYRLLHFRPSEEPHPHHALFPYKLFWSFLKQKPLRLLYLLMVGNQIASWSLLFLLPDYLLSRLYPSWIVYGGGHFFLLFGAALGPPIAGYLADHTSVKRVITFLSAITILLFYGLVAPVALPNFLLFTLLAGVGASMSSISPLVWSFGNQLAHNYRGVLNAFLMGFVWIITETLGTGLSGFIATQFTIDAPAKALACMGGGLFLAAACALRLPEMVATSPISIKTAVGEKSQ